MPEPLDTEVLLEGKIDGGVSIGFNCDVEAVLMYGFEGAVWIVFTWPAENEFTEGAVWIGATRAVEVAVLTGLLAGAVWIGVTWTVEDEDVGIEGAVWIGVTAVVDTAVVGTVGAVWVGVTVVVEIALDGIEGGVWIGVTVVLVVALTVMSVGSTILTVVVLVATPGPELTVPWVVGLFWALTANIIPAISPPKANNPSMPNTIGQHIPPFSGATFETGLTGYFFFS